MALTNRRFNVAQYRIKGTCGHEWREQLYGHQSERERRIEWLSGRECPDCYKARLARERAEESAKAATVAQASGLPGLVGSPKQIAWAETIRAEKIAEVARIEAVIDSADRDPATPIEVQGAAAFEQMRARYQFETSAKWWIDTRDQSVRDQVVALVRAAQAVVPTAIAEAKKIG